MQNEKTGTLYVVATPIGNLDDVTLRAIATLKMVDRVAAEDTRHAGKLLKHFNISVPSFSLHDHNESQRIEQITAYLEQGESIALISDAGTPLISDPGFHLVKALRAKGMHVVPIPGACAAITALCVSGLPSDRFTFEGFLPATKTARQSKLEALQRETRTMIFYEAARRLLAMLSDVQAVFGQDCEICIARELTKLHESIKTQSVATLIDYYEQHPDQLKGEVVVLVKGVNLKEQSVNQALAEKMLTTLMADLPLKQAASLTSQVTGINKKSLYELGLKKK